MNGHMAEAQEGFVPLKEVDAATFIRFAQWAYQGYYTAAASTIDYESASLSANVVEEECSPGPVEAAEPVPAEGPPAEPEPEVEMVEAHAIDGWGQPIQPVPDGWGATTHNWRSRASVKKSKGKKVDCSVASRTTEAAKHDLKEAFINRKYTSRGESIIPPPRPNQKPEENYSGVFLSHARLYVFADMYDIQPLKLLALEELHATLAIFELYSQRTSDIIALLRYVYAHTIKPLDGEDMRAMLTQYIGYEMETLFVNDDFRALMIEDGGELLADFMGMVEKRIS